MFAQYFGQYLLSRGLVSPEQLGRAMTAQQETRVKLGVLAINHGYLTPAQVDTIHQAQTRMDKRIGEIAVELGFMTAAQVDELLASQQSSHLALGQALIDHGIMSYETFASALNQYKEEYSLSDEQFESIMNGSIEDLLTTLLKRAEVSVSSTNIDYIALFAKNVIRFIDSDIRVELADANAAAASNWTARQPIESAGGTSRITAIDGSEAAFLQLASLYADEPIEAPDDMMEAAVGEFLNLHNGIYLVNLSNSGVELSLKPQAVARAAEAEAIASPACSVRIVGPQCDIVLTLAELDDLH